MLFLDRVNPDSKHMNPGCMRKTKLAQINNQTISIMTTTLK